MATLIKFDDLDIEALTEAAKEAFEEVTWSLEKTLTHATNFGRILSSVRNKIPHGQWVPWVQETFGDTISLRKIQRYMQIANVSDQTLLDGAKTIDEALERISEPKLRQPSVEVIEVEASVPEQQLSPVTTEPATAKAELKVEKKSPTVSQISQTLIRLGADKKRHSQLIQIATEALHRLTPEERFEVLASQLNRLTPEQRGQLIETLQK